MNHNSHIAHQFGCSVVEHLIIELINYMRALGILYKDDLLTFVLSRGKSTTLHNRNLQHLAIEMYELKNNISPCALIDFISIKETNYD